MQSETPTPPAGHPHEGRLDPFKLVAARGASILAGWANNSSEAKRAARRRAAGLCDPLQAPQIGADAEAKIAAYLEAYLREKLAAEIDRGYHNKVNVCFSTDYEPDHRIKAMCIALEIFGVEWPWKRHLWLRAHGGGQGGEFGADEDHCQRTLKCEEGRPWGWLVSPYVIPRQLHDLAVTTEQATAWALLGTPRTLEVSPNNYKAALTAIGMTAADAHWKHLVALFGQTAARRKVTKAILGRRLAPVAKVIRVAVGENADGNYSIQYEGDTPLVYAAAGKTAAEIATALQLLFVGNTKVSAAVQGGTNIDFTALEIEWSPGYGQGEAPARRAPQGAKRRRRW